VHTRAKDSNEFELLFSAMGLLIIDQFAGYSPILFRTAVQDKGAVGSTRRVVVAADPPLSLDD
jgi:hypothetical protein